MIYTHYDYLELPPGAQPERINTAYAQLVSRFHVNDEPLPDDMSLLVRRIHAAYEVLRDHEARKNYDEQLALQAAQADAELKADLDRLVIRPLRRVQNVPGPLNSMFAALAA